MRSIVESFGPSCSAAGDQSWTSPRANAVNLLAVGADLRRGEKSMLKKENVYAEWLRQFMAQLFYSRRDACNHLSSLHQIYQRPLESIAGAPRVG